MSDMQWLESSDNYCECIHCIILVIGVILWSPVSMISKYFSYSDILSCSSLLRNHILRRLSYSNQSIIAASPILSHRRITFLRGLICSAISGKYLTTVSLLLKVCIRGSLRPIAYPLSSQIKVFETI